MGCILISVRLDRQTYWRDWSSCWRDCLRVQWRHRGGKEKVDEGNI